MGEVGFKPRDLGSDRGYRVASGGREIKFVGRTDKSVCATG
jgi:hypothetical protein